MTATQGRFARELSSLDDLFRLLESFAADARLSASLAAELAVVAEELFVNAVRHNRGEAETVHLSLTCQDDWLELRLVDRQTTPFDITAAPLSSLDRPIEERRSGGMGLHLVRQLADELAYTYEDGRSIITLRRRLPKNNVHCSN